MDKRLRNLLKIPYERLDSINAVLLDPDSQVMNEFLAVVAKYGTPEEINRKHLEARKLEHLLKKVKSTAPDHLADLEWLMEQRDRKAFVPLADYRKRVLRWESGEDEIQGCISRHTRSLGAAILPLDSTDVRACH